MSDLKKLILPCLRGQIGDWIYYVTLLKFEEVSNRVSMVPEIHKNIGLSNLIQREISDRTVGIVEYLKTQDQRFFNSLILGVYGGHPKWHELRIEESIIDNLIGDNEENVILSDHDIENLSSTLGVLILNGKEKIFAIDGQHRTKSIKDAVMDKPSLKSEEIPAIFVAHKKTLEGEVRTRRLFSTINRYAKPVSKSEIIAIDEEDNCAIITRNIVENFDLLNGKILFNKSRGIAITNKLAFTNIIVLYDFITTILTNNRVFGINVGGKEHKKFILKRESELVLSEQQIIVESLFTRIFAEIPVLLNFIEGEILDRRLNTSSLLFRPVGQNVFYSVLKIAIHKNILDEAIIFFADNDFSLNNPTWNKVFTDPETNRMKTDKTVQKFATQIILIHLGLHINLTEKDKDIHENYQIDSSNLEIIEQN
ncbi:DGQHR domain-containing protein [bacterium AH-315-A23]|nr:DGQHR domain-containing protein [bacterium AH-315-A23]